MPEHSHRSSLRAGTPARFRPVLVLEINEVPWRLVDRAVGSGRYGALREFFGRAETRTTVSEDVGELSPWVTWPSFHRGMSNVDHGIRNLGQDVATFRGTPIWSEYRARGYDIGVCGSLQSWPPVDPGPGGFYIPDTFAHDEACVPRFVEPIQRFNLRQVRRNGRVLDRRTPFSLDDLRLGPALFRARPSMRFVAEVAKQLVGERLDATKCARRPVFQALLYWEVFKRLYRPKTPPAFATFFTNHVAGTMHRYWKDYFPEDFGETSGSRGPHHATMEYALQSADRIVADALAFQRKRPDLLVVFASSMGQAAVHRDHHGREVAVKDTLRLLRAFDVAQEGVAVLLAMVPQVAVEIADEGARRRTRAALEGCRATTGEALFRVDETGRTLSITLFTPSRSAVDAGGFFADGELRRFLTWADAGIEVLATEAGTAYHVPEGVLAVVGEGVAANASRAPLPAPAAKRYLMELGGLVTTRAEPPPSPMVSRPGSQSRLS